MGRGAGAPPADVVLRDGQQGALSAREPPSRSAGRGLQGFLRLGGLRRDGLCRGHGGWGGLRTESPHGAGAMEAKSRNSLQEGRAICELSSISCCPRDLGSRTCFLIEAEMTVVHGLQGCCAG